MEIYFPRIYLLVVQIYNVAQIVSFKLIVKYDQAFPFSFFAIFPFLPSLPPSLGFLAFQRGGMTRGRD